MHTPGSSAWPVPWSVTSATSRTSSSPSSVAAVRGAVDMVDEGLISEDEAIARVPPNDLNQLFHPTVDPKAKLDLLATGLAASPGAASGIAIFDADRAEARARSGDAVILVRNETSPEDFHGMVL